MKEEEYDKIWNSILDSIKIRDVEIWNYEKLDIQQHGNYMFFDETHLSKKGAQIFTKIIKDRIK